MAFLFAEAAALAGTGQPSADQGHLKGIIAAGHVIVLTQVGLLVLLLVTMIVARVQQGTRFGQPVAEACRRASLESPDRDERTEETPLRPALWGFAGWFIATAAVLLGFAYSAAVVFRLSDVLTGEVERRTCDECTTHVTAPEPAPAFEIGAFATGLFVVLLIPILAYLLLRTLARRTRALAWVRSEYPSELKMSDSDYRVQRAVRPRAFASAVSLDQLRPILVLASAVGIIAASYSAWDALRSSGWASVEAVVGTVPDVAQATAEETGALARFYSGNEVGPPEAVRIGFNFLRDFGSWAMAGLAVALIALGGLAWRNEKARRIIGIIWDVLSFWPRAGHPLAAPCYAERAVPQLTSRIAYLVSDPAEDTTVVIAGHSQGSIISVAAIAQLQTKDRAYQHVALLTYGSPLMRLYAPIFPRLFWPTHLEQLSVIRRCKWTNLWRRTDPIAATAAGPGS